MKKLIQTIDFIEDFMRWSRKRKDIRAVALAGSYARGAATESSDVDLVIIAEKPQKYLASTEWVRIFGKAIAQKEEKRGELVSLRVWYESGLEVEYGFTTYDWAKIPPGKGMKQVIDNGMRVLFEKEVLLSPYETPMHRSQHDRQGRPAR